MTYGCSGKTTPGGGLRGALPLPLSAVAWFEVLADMLSLGDGRCVGCARVSFSQSGSAVSRCHLQRVVVQAARVASGAVLCSSVLPKGCVGYRGQRQSAVNELEAGANEGEDAASDVAVC